MQKSDILEEKFMTRKECDIVQKLVDEKIDGIKREIKIAFYTSTTITSIFLTILAILFRTGVI